MLLAANFLCVKEFDLETR